MRSFFRVAIAVVFLACPAQFATAQSPEIPIPQVVIKDVNGLVIAPIFAMTESERPLVVFDFDGKQEMFEVILSIGRFEPVVGVFFTGTDCSGQIFTSERRGPFFGVTGTTHVIFGPHPDDGTYQMFRTTGEAVPATIASHLDQATGGCVNEAWGADLYPAETMIPNPFEDYRGPTSAAPTPGFSVSGGTRLP